MGICVSSCSSSKAVIEEDDDVHMKSSANVVSIGGQLRQYPLPIKVSRVLQSEVITSTSSPAIFLCNSDSLYYDDYIPALSPDAELQSAQIYFVLPASKLRYRLSASDMAALAVKASIALESQKNSSSSRKKNKARISPLLVEVEKREQEEANVIKAHADYNESNKKQRASSSSSGLGVSRSRSLRKQQRYSSRRAKLAVRSFKIRLTTIYEGSVLVFN